MAQQSRRVRLVVAFSHNVNAVAAVLDRDGKVDQLRPIYPGRSEAGRRGEPFGACFCARRVPRSTANKLAVAMSSST
jgi:hypothetical protein